MKTLTPLRETVKLRAITRQGFATRLRAWRESTGLSQKAFAKALGLHSNTISAWENGENGPKLDTMAQIAQAFEIDWHHLITGAPPRGVPTHAVVQAYATLRTALGTYAETLGQTPPGGNGQR